MCLGLQNRQVKNFTWRFEGILYVVREPSKLSYAIAFGTIAGTLVSLTWVLNAATSVSIASCKCLSWVSMRDTRSSYSSYSCLVGAAWALPMTPARAANLELSLAG